MTEIPESLRKRAEEARQKAALASPGDIPSDPTLAHVRRQMDTASQAPARVVVTTDAHDPSLTDLPWFRLYLAGCLDPIADG